jgi:hypothetical protein
MSSPASTLLDRLQRVKQTRPGQWQAACPICESRTGRPLAVKDADGRVLIHAFCGCRTDDVLGRLGLSVNDLFDAPLTMHAAPAQPTVPARDVLAALAHEATVVAVIANDFLATKQISEEDWQRLAKAVNRLGAARAYV